MKRLFICVLLIMLTSVYAQTNLQTAMNELLEYYNPKTLKTKSLGKLKWTSSKGKILNRPIDKDIAQKVLHADYKFYANIYPGEILINNQNIVALNYILICAAGGFCEYEKLVILKKSGEFIGDFEYGKNLSDLSSSLIKENVFVSDSLLIFKTSHIKRNPELDSITSTNIEMQTIHISDEGEIKIVARNKIDSRRKYCWISTDIAQDSTLAKFSKPELAEMRNEIFASYGFKFKGEKWQKLFWEKDWYEARYDNVNESLSIIERKNIEKILRFENDEIWWKNYIHDLTNEQDYLQYEIQYPSNWYVKMDSFSTKTKAKILLIENIREKVIVAGGGPFTEHGSFFKISVYTTSREQSIKDIIMNGDLPEKVKKKRLLQMQEREIGGIKTIVWEGSGWADKGYNFTYKGRRFNIHFISGSKEQFENDLPIFNKMMESVKIFKK